MSHLAKKIEEITEDGQKSADSESEEGFRFRIEGSFRPRQSQGKWYILVKTRSLTAGGLG